jgi:hypothetical protein
MYLAPCAIALFLMCGGPIQQFYPDTFYPQDRIYENKSLGFALQFQGNWSVITDPNEMNESGKRAALSLQESAAELLFMGMTFEGTQGCRGIVEHLNLSNEQFIQEVRKANEESLEKDLGTTDMVINGKSVIRWEYELYGFRYVEFIMKISTYNIRIAFWTTPRLYEEFLPVYHDIMASLMLLGGI